MADGRAALDDPAKMRAVSAPSAEETNGSVRLAAAAVITLNVLLPVIEVWRVALPPEAFNLTGSSLAALIATMCALPLYLRHVTYALHGERAPGAAWSLTALAALNVAAAVLVGPGWLMNFAVLAVSVLIVLPARWSLPLFATIVVAAGAIAGPAPGWPGAYVALSVAWRSVTLFVLVRLVATFRQLEDARRELRDRAVVRERLRIQTELHRGLGGALSQIVSRADGAARATAEWDVTAATTELRALVGDSSQALADARRLVAGYRASSVRAELEAAVTLLGAAGIEPRVMAEDDAALELADKSSRDAVRAAVIQALRDDTLSGVVIHVGRDDDGLRVRLSAVERAEPRGVDAR